MGAQIEEWILLFDSIHDVLGAERLFKERGVPVDLVPTPRMLSADCGMAIAVGGGHRDAVAAILALPGCRHRSIQRVVAGGYEEVTLP